MESKFSVWLISQTHLLISNLKKKKKDLHPHKHTILCCIIYKIYLDFFIASVTGFMTVLVRTKKVPKNKYWKK